VVIDLTPPSRVAAQENHAGSTLSCGVGSGSPHTLDTPLVPADPRALWGNDELVLYGRLRGRGGNVGVVTTPRLRAQHDRPAVFAGMIRVPPTSPEALSAMISRWAMLDPELSLRTLCDPGDPADRSVLFRLWTGQDGVAARYAREAASRAGELWISGGYGKEAQEEGIGASGEHQRNAAPSRRLPTEPSGRDSQSEEGRQGELGSV